MDGIKLYFASYWNIYAFFIIILAYIIVIFDLTIICGAVTAENVTFFVLLMFAIRLIQLLALIRVLTIYMTICPRIIKYCDDCIDRKIASAYDIGRVRDPTLLNTYTTITVRDLERIK